MKKIAKYAATTGMIMLLLICPTLGWAENHQEAQHANDVADDAYIVLQIKNKIKNEPLLKKVADNIKVTSKYGNVNLSGLVDTNMQAEKIIVFTQSLKWVKDIDTINLKIKNSKEPLTDSFTTFKVKGVLLREGFSPNAIHVETKNRVVFLTGTVYNQEQINKITSLITNIKDVSSIENGLKIK